MKKLINKILRLFGYHLVKNPRPYKREKDKISPDDLLNLIDQKRCPDHGTDYKKRCNVCRYIMGKIPIDEI